MSDWAEFHKDKSKKSISCCKKYITNKAAEKNSISFECIKFKIGKNNFFYGEKWKYKDFIFN